MALKQRTAAVAASLVATLMCAASPVALAGPEQDSENAEKEFARGDLIAAISMWRKAAGQGYAPAQARLGDILDKSEDDEEAVKWYRKAAAQGNAAGEFGLGLMYGKGEGVAKDLVQARDYVRRAAEKDYLPAAIVMAEMYKSGSLGAVIDLEQSEQWKAKVKALTPKEAPKAAAPAATESASAAASAVSAPAPATAK